MRALPAQKPVTIDLQRKGGPLQVQVTPKPDWEKAPDYAPPLAVAVRRAPGSIAYAYAQAHQLIDSSKLVNAKALIDEWRESWRTSAAGQLAMGDLLAKQVRWKQALGAYSRARKKQDSAAAELGRGIALSKLGKDRPSLVAFSAAARLDPADPSAQGFRSYALMQENRVAEAVAAGQAAVALDARYADGFLPLGMALIASGDKANGVKALRRGLILLEEPDRADMLIRTQLAARRPLAPWRRRRAVRGRLQLPGRLVALLEARRARPARGGARAAAAGAAAAAGVGAPGEEHDRQDAGGEARPHLPLGQRVLGEDAVEQEHRDHADQGQGALSWRRQVDGPRGHDRDDQEEDRAHVGGTRGAFRGRGPGRH